MTTMNIIKKYFSQEARYRRTLQADIKRLDTLRRLADKAINVTYKGDGIWLTIDGTPTFRVTNDSDINARTIAISQVDMFVRDLRENWIGAHKDDLPGQRL